MTTVVVSGAMANKPGNGGEAWVRLSWVRGLQRLGCSAHLVEQIDAAVCTDASGAAVDFEESVNLQYFEAVIKQFGLEDTSALIHDRERGYGMSHDRLSDVADDADLLVNISGHLRLPRLLKRFKRRAYVDIDPGFTQFWHSTGRLATQVLDHHLHFTIGENVGSAGCTIPTGGLRWIPTRQPVTIDDWPVVGSATPDRFTTVGSWRGPYGPIEHEGGTLGLKVHEFRKFVNLPQKASPKFELALTISPDDEADRRLLVDHGWHLVDPSSVTPDPDSFRAFVQGSGAEFSVAQGVYVHTRSGWFSDRSARYLASGKPVLVQDTGFGRHLPVGEGLLAFRALDDAASAAETIVSNYDAHAKAARVIAREYFDAERVLSRFLDLAGVT